MSGLIGKLLHWRLARYMVASASGTVVDLGSFLILLAAGAAPVAAGISGYLLGMILHWFISSRFVFADRLAGPGLARGGQQVLFAASAALGLGITAGVIGWTQAAGIDPRLGKLAAMALSFLCVWLVRLLVVFRRT